MSYDKAMLILLNLYELLLTAQANTTPVSPHLLSVIKLVCRKFPLKLPSYRSNLRECVGKRGIWGYGEPI